MITLGVKHIPQDVLFDFIRLYTYALKMSIMN